MRKVVTALILTGAVLAAAGPAAAKCTRLGFSVNDYGKDGPTKDAKELLDKYVAKWAAEHNIAKYTIGKKDVKCELFLNLIVFDEHTCRAEASVCWNEAPGQKPFVPDASTADKPAPAAKKKATAAPAVKPAPTETATIPAPAKKTIAPAAIKAAVPPAAPAEQSAAEKAAAAAEEAARAAQRAAAAAEKAAAAAAKVQPAVAPQPAPAAAAPVIPVLKVAPPAPQQ